MFARWGWANPPLPASAVRNHQRRSLDLDSGVSLEISYVSRMLRFRIMYRLLLWDNTHLPASQIYVDVNPQLYNMPKCWLSVDGCKTLNVWRETTCSSLFSGTWLHILTVTVYWCVFLFYKWPLGRDYSPLHKKPNYAASIKFFSWAPQSFDKLLDLNSSLYSGILLVIGTFPLWVLPRCSSPPLHGLLYTLKYLFCIWIALDLV